MQRATEKRREHVDAMTRHRDKVNDYDAWLTQARIDASGDVMVTLDTAYLKEQKRDNKVTVNVHC